jgi:hypothetical protein
MKLVKIVQQKRFGLELQDVEIVTESIERNVLKKRGKMSLRMRQADAMNFMQGEIIDLRDERKANRKNEKRAKKRMY